MLEAIVTGSIAIVSGVGAYSFRTHSRLSALDQRIDDLNLILAKDYLSKKDFSEVVNRLELSTARIEQKIDSLITKNLK